MRGKNHGLLDSWHHIRLLALGVLVGSISTACSGGSDFTPPTASFSSSGTAARPNLVRFVEKAQSGEFVTVDVELSGRTSSNDIYGFAFEIELGNPNVVELVPGSAASGALLEDEACSGFTVQANQSRSRVVVGASKLGPCVGSGVAMRQSRSILQLTFKVLTPGESTLSFSGPELSGPIAVDSSGQAIPSIEFDVEPAAIVGT
jgi:hypothetical protein